MRIARAQVPARAALAGNPSDGYGGAVLAVAVANFRAEAVAYEWPTLEILPAPEDAVAFAGLAELAGDVDRHGYYGGLRIAKAALRQLHAVLGPAYDGSTFTLRYGTSIPRGVGLGGSSAIAIAVLRAAAELLGVELGPERTARLALSAEVEELGIEAGLQDRIAEAYGGVTYMSFGAEPEFTPLEADPPPLWLAWLPESAEPSGVVHQGLRARHGAGEPAVLRSMAELAGIARGAREAVEAADPAALADAMDATLEARASILELDPRHLAMAAIGNDHGSGVNFAGSGGAVVGCPRDGSPTGFGMLAESFAGAGCSFAALSPAPSTAAAG